MLAQYIRDRGMQEGMQQGIQQEMQQGMQQGMLLDARDMFIEVLTERFGGINSELSEQIQRIDSREKLKSLLRQALRAKSFNEFGKNCLKKQ